MAVTRSLSHHLSALLLSSQELVLLIVTGLVTFDSDSLDMVSMCDEANFDKFAFSPSVQLGGRTLVCSAFGSYGNQFTKAINHYSNWDPVVLGCCEPADWTKKDDKRMGSSVGSVGSPATKKRLRSRSRGAGGEGGGGGGR